MRAYHIARFGSIDGNVLQSSEDPRPGQKEVLMRVGASSLNYRDLMALTKAPVAVRPGSA
jgi:NADPH:quinone reductase-like Zn-dependent oxidoreductase